MKRIPFHSACVRGANAGNVWNFGNPFFGRTEMIRLFVNTFQFLGLGGSFITQREKQEAALPHRQANRVDSRGLTDWFLVRSEHSTGRADAQGNGHDTCAPICWPPSASKPPKGEWKSHSVIASFRKDQHRGRRTIGRRVVCLFLNKKMEKGKHIRCFF